MTRLQKNLDELDSSTPLAVLSGDSRGLNHRMTPPTLMSASLGTWGVTTEFRLYDDHVITAMLPRGNFGLKPMVIEEFAFDDIRGCCELDGERDRTSLEARSSGGLLGGLMEASRDYSVHYLELVTVRGDIRMKTPILGKRRAFMIAFANLIEDDIPPPPGAPVGAPPSWLPDPLGRFQYRWWDGSNWTDRVARDGATSLDPLG